MSEENELVENVVEVEETPKDEKGICFVIMPFGGYQGSYYVDIYKQAILDAGLEPIRADDLFRAGTIVKDIWELTKSAKILLADLSGKNPNVMYELGLAHAITKPVVLVTENIEDVPFDLRALRVLEYNKNEAHWGGKLRSNITQALLEVLEDPIRAVPAPFLEVVEGGQIEVTELQKQLLENRRDINALRNLILSTPRMPSGFELRASKYQVIESNEGEPLGILTMDPLVKNIDIKPKN